VKTANIVVDAMPTVVFQMRGSDVVVETEFPGVTRGDSVWADITGESSCQPNIRQESIVKRSTSTEGLQ